jgi:hypothetical protein
MTRGYLRTTISHDPTHVAMWAEKIGPQGWIILESYPAITFKLWRPGEALPELGAEFAGRIFGDRGELRWTREGSTFDLWLFEDAEAAGEEGALFDIEERYYYAVGYWREGRFWESSLPSDRVEYPIGNSKDDDRPRFKVFEYYRTIPTEWPDDPDRIEDMINQPSLAAYRLAGFDAGKDGE